MTASDSALLGLAFAVMLGLVEVLKILLRPLADKMNGKRNSGRDNPGHGCRYEAVTVALLNERMGKVLSVLEKIEEKLE